MLIKLSMTALFVALSFTGLAFTRNDTIFPEVGKVLPQFKLEDVQYYEKTKVSSKDFRGKWLVLDFWNQTCPSCIEKFAEINELKQKTKSQVEYLLVGYTGSQYARRSENQSIRALFEVVKKSSNLDLPIAYDSVLFHQFNIYNCPYVIIVDPLGVVRGITYEVTENEIREFVGGGLPKLPKVWRKNENKIVYDPNRPFLLDLNGGKESDYLIRSTLSRWNDYMPMDINFRIKNDFFQVIGLDLKSLYLYSYFGITKFIFDDKLYGSIHPFPIIETIDSAVFSSNLKLRENMFCYSLHVPGRTFNKQFVMDKLRQELTSYFGFQVRIEKRQMPYWAIVECEKMSKMEIGMRDIVEYKSIKAFIRDLYIYNMEKQLIFIIECKECEKLPIRFNCDYTDIESVKRCLGSAGLDLVERTREMDVLVIY